MTVSHSPSPPLTAPLAPSSQARISFRQPIAEAGFVDGAWWPRSRDLLAELPPLFDVLWAACRDVTHVSYNLTFWKPAPRRLELEGRVIRLGGFRLQDPLLITLFDSSGREHIDILVVPPEAAAELAKRVLRLAGGVGSTERPARILELAAAATPASSGPA